jgi:hypothetical protein
MDMTPQEAEKFQKVWQTIDLLTGRKEAIHGLDALIQILIKTEVIKLYPLNLLLTELKEDKK